MSVRSFAAVDAANPGFWLLFEKFTFEMIGRGLDHYSADAVLHRVRWETATPLRDASEFKVNNNWSSYYARKFHATHPQHADFFRIRTSKADNVSWMRTMNAMSATVRDPKKLLAAIAKYLEGPAPNAAIAAGALRKVIGAMP